MNYSMLFNLISSYVLKFELPQKFFVNEKLFLEALQDGKKHHKVNFDNDVEAINRFNWRGVYFDVSHMNSPTVLRGVHFLDGKCKFYTVAING